ncbi:MAG: hypothetical protein AAFR59_13000 [Bacteroidota bacterium]
MSSADIIFKQRVAKLEARHERISAILTTVIMLLLASLLFIYQLVRAREMQQIGDDDKYEVMGSIDFGDFSQGSRAVNNFDPPVENPTPSPNPQPQPVQQPQQNTPAPAAPTEAATPADANPTPSEVITSENPAPVTQPPAAEPQPQETPPTTPTTVETTTPQEESPNNTGSSTDPSEDEDDEPLLFENTGGGSNDGDADSGTGNSGADDVKVLDPDGLYSFGVGEGQGLTGRKPISLNKPSYTVQEEGRITYKFTIGPDGSVQNVRAISLVQGNQLGIKRAGELAIYRWKFSKGKRQTVTVTITFKLK